MRALAASALRYQIRPLLCAPGQARQSSSEDWGTNQPAARYRWSPSPPEDGASIWA